ncbi:MAG: leucyl aminopeptidase [Anaerolineaceae bacterium 4572_32.2]|nr:MAG: leucyl aminopeptidase [Anaerolineaceae bacterium 4572_32.2]
MNIKPIPGAIQASDADAIIVNLFQDAQPFWNGHSDGTQPGGATKAVDQSLDGAISDLISGGDFSGKADQVAVLYPRGAIPARRVILVGLGPREKFNVDVVRRAAARAIQKARDLKAGRVATILHGAGAGELSIEEAAQATAEGSLLGLYDYRGQKTDDAPEPLPKSLELAIFDEGDVPAAQRGAEAGRAIAAGVALTRDLVNLPPNICTPAYMAQAAAEMAEEVGLRVEVLERKQMEALKMGALLAVAQGSDTPPRFIILEHNGDRASELDSIVLVGKGVTFDTGGYSLKPKEGMGRMKADMAGAGAVIGAMYAIGALDVDLHVVGLAPAADNMIGSHAYRPQEVVTASNGVTIEINSTDAEGRMLLADALVYAARFQPAAVVDIATLTGACATALGRVAAGLFSTDDGLRDVLLSAADASAEKLWPLPLFPEYEKTLESQTADIRNSAGIRAGVGSSATFLKHFVSYPAWAHVDMAGLALEAKDNPYVPGKGATGFGARLLTEFARQWAQSSRE